MAYEAASERRFTRVIPLGGSCARPPLRSRRIRPDHLREAISGCLIIGLLTMSRPCAAGAQSSRPMELSDVSTLVRVGDPQLSPDGHLIAIVVSRQTPDGKAYHQQLMLIDVATAAQRVLVDGPHGLSQPRWSPAGDRIGFLALVTTSAGAQAQVHVQSVNGTPARQITTAVSGVQQFAWRPDGQAIAYVAADTAPNQTALDNGDDAFEVGDDDMFETSAPLPSHIWIVPSEGGSATRLTSGRWSVATGPPIPFLSWAPDRRSIAFMWQAGPHGGDAYDTKVATVDVATGAIHDVTGRRGFEGYPVYSPDGSRIAFFYPRGRDPNNVNQIDVVPSQGGSVTVVTHALDRSLYRAAWMPDSRSLIVGGNDGVRVSLWLVDSSGTARRLDLGDVSPTWANYWVVADVGRNGAIAFTGSTGQRPIELYYMSSPMAAPTRLTDFNGAITRLALGRVDSLHWRGPDGFAEDGVVVYPPSYRTGKRYPLVLWIHGGPQASSAETWDVFAQAIASRGSIVFSPNYRGSDNLGNAYERAIVRDATRGPARDIMAGIAALERSEAVDKTRLAVSGWSYGGTMTVWLIGHYRGWAAAVAGAPVVDFADQYALSDLNTTIGTSFGGSPWHANLGELYRAQAPLSFAQAIRTPTLLLHDLSDQRSPPPGSFKLYHALKDNGVPVSFVVYPVAGHFPADPMHARDILRRWVEWLDRYLLPRN
jgi:dipeptidyl aminopeptidase/acylaminoacyl peptidase